jgi:endoglucanase
MFYDSFYGKRIIGSALCLTILGSVAGCGASSAELPAEIADFGAAPSGLSPDYEEPVQIPGTMVDQIGFSVGSEKAVVFKGENPPQKFAIVDSDSGETVYTGQALKPSYSEALSEYYCQGYFSDFDKVGSYYIYTDELGESYSFTIKEDSFRELFAEAMRKYYINRCGIALSGSLAGQDTHSACHTTVAHLQEDPSVSLDVTGGWHMDASAGRDAALGSRIGEMLLLAYELNPTAFSDDTGIPESGNNIPDILDEVKYEADWLLKMQDTRTGGEYGSAATDSGRGDVFAAPVYVTPVSMDATISFASMMARLSYFYQKYDPEFATTALKAADRAFTCFLNNKKPEDDTAAFKAAAQLYRATGSEVYRKVLDGYFSLTGFDSMFETDRNIFLGSVTYLTTSRQVDVARCTALMKLLMKTSENIAQRASGSPFLVSDETLNGGVGELLSDMLVLTITNHIIYNYEYTTIIENHVHYLGGMNPKALNYLTADTDRSYAKEDAAGVLSDPESTALLIFMLSVLEK